MRNVKKLGLRVDLDVKALFDVRNIKNVAKIKQFRIKICIFDLRK